MIITKTTVSNIPTILSWLALLTLIYIYFHDASKETVNQIPHSVNIITLSMAGLFLLRFLLEKILPKREVMFAKKENDKLIINSGGIKYLNQSIALSEISDVKIGKTYFHIFCLYIFLKNGNVKIVSNSLNELKRLHSFINQLLEQ